MGASAVRNGRSADEPTTYTTLPRPAAGSRQFVPAGGLMVCAEACVETRSAAPAMSVMVFMVLMASDPPFGRIDERRQPAVSGTEPDASAVVEVDALRVRAL